MSIIRDQCCICSNKIIHIETFNNYPIKFSMTKNLEHKYKDLKFMKCINCNTFQLGELIPLEQLYCDAHNNEVIGKTWINHFKEFAAFINFSHNNLKNVSEIGGPTDKIFKYINNYNKWTLLDPNAKIYGEKITTINKFFDKDFKLNHCIDTIIHSHLLEHLYSPNELLYHMNNILSENGQMFISVPNMEFYAKTETPFNGMHFEHTYFLNETNIIHLANNNNFEIINKKYYNNHSIFYHLIKKNISSNSVHLMRQYNISYTHLFNEKINYFKNLVKDINKKITNMDQVYIFGCHTNSQIMVYFNLNITNIRYILDNDKSKHEQYFYGTYLLCKSPEILKDIKNPKIICYIGNYTSEVIEQLKNINNSIVFL